MQYYQCLSPLTLWVRTPLRRGVLDTTLCDKVRQLLGTGQWFSLYTPVSSTNKSDHHDITEILLKVALNTINHNNLSSFYELFNLKIVSAIWILYHTYLISHYNFITHKYKWAVLIPWYNMQVCMLYHSLSVVTNINHFISVTKHIFHVSYSWTYLSSLILRISLFK
jgi:hypothetical protein